MTRAHRHAGALILATLGILILIAGLALHWWRPETYALEAVPIIVGAAIAFAGFYAMDPKGSKDGGGFFVDQGIKILGVIRSGRRATDIAVVAPSPSLLPIDHQDGDIDSPPHLGGSGAPEVPHIPEVPAPEHQP